ncbi:MAG: hypothetical protein HOP11_12700 [Saprospiraceae bacterium]|nr:hypothetical protein [Saprospiraceae bacterium]
MKVKDLSKEGLEKLLRLKREEIIQQIQEQYNLRKPFLLTACKGQFGYFVKIVQFKINDNNNKIICISELFNADKEIIDELEIGMVYFGETLALEQTLERKSGFRVASKFKFPGIIYLGHLNYQPVYEKYELKPEDSKDIIIQGIEYNIVMPNSNNKSNSNFEDEYDPSNENESCDLDYPSARDNPYFDSNRDMDQQDPAFWDYF